MTPEQVTAAAQQLGVNLNSEQEQKALENKLETMLQGASGAESHNGRQGSNMFALLLAFYLTSIKGSNAVMMSGLGAVKLQNLSLSGAESQLNTIQTNLNKDLTKIKNAVKKKPWWKTLVTVVVSVAVMAVLGALTSGILDAVAAPAMVAIEGAEIGAEVGADAVDVTAEVASDAVESTDAAAEGTADAADSSGDAPDVPAGGDGAGDGPLSAEGSNSPETEQNTAVENQAQNARQTTRDVSKLERLRNAFTKGGTYVKGTALGLAGGIPLGLQRSNSEATGATNVQLGEATTDSSAQQVASTEVDINVKKIESAQSATQQQQINSIEQGEQTASQQIGSIIGGESQVYSIGQG